MRFNMNKILSYIMLLFIIGCSSNQNVLRIDDLLGVLSETGAPVTVEVKLNKEQLVAV